MELFWKNKMLNFPVHLKANQQLKYLNRDSTHPKHCFNAISKGLFKRLANEEVVHLHLKFVDSFIEE